jgi:hypothetical protein
MFSSPVMPTLSPLATYLQAISRPIPELAPTIIILCCAMRSIVNVICIPFGHDHFSKPKNL